VEPALTIERAQLDRFLQALEESLKAVQAKL
jgi:4-aminobutyrate aminotransferase-like enzyme